MSATIGRDAAAAAREAALQMLYARELAGQDPDCIQDWYLAAHPLRGAVRVHAGRLFDGAVAQQARIEELIRRHAVGWRLERMSVIDRSLLKLATAELLASPARPVPEVIQATLRLAKKFSQPEALKFVHAMLEAIARDIATGSKAGSG